MLWMVFLLVKISKEMLNELLKYVIEDNLKYGLIFKITYVYGRNIGEVLKLKTSDVDFKHDTIDFDLPTENVSFKLHEDVKRDLISYLEEKSLKNSDYLFIDDALKVNNYSKKLNFYLNNFINDLNRNVLSWHCPTLVNRDFKNLRGQHLFLDGADVKTVNMLYRNKNIQSTKDNIEYKELLAKKFPCTSLKKVFEDFTDLNVFFDTNFKNSDLFTVCKGDDTLILEYDYDMGVFNMLGDESSDVYNEVKNFSSDDLIVQLKNLDTGNYKYVEGLRFIKN